MDRHSVGLARNDALSACPAVRQPDHCGGQRGHIWNECDRRRRRLTLLGWTRREVRQGGSIDGTGPLLALDCRIAAMHLLSIPLALVDLTASMQAEVPILMRRALRNPKRAWMVATNYRRLLLATLLGFSSPACATWHPYVAPAQLEPGQSLPYRLRAARTDGTRLALTAPFARSDTLFGRVRGDTIGVPVAEIARLERERFSPVRSVVTFVAVPLATYGIIYGILCSTSCGAGGNQ